MIHEEICTYEVAKLAKEKGFDCICQNYYNINSELIIHKIYVINHINSQIEEGCITAPTQSLLHRWLREEKAIAIVLQPYSYNIQRGIYTWIYEIWADNNLEKTSKSFKTYELALEDALKYALRNLV